MFSHPPVSTSLCSALTRRARSAIVLALAAGATCLAISPAVATAEPACKEEVLSQPFLKWGDKNVYALVPGGDFEKGLAGWALAGGAKTVSGSETYGVSGSVGKYSLELPAGASATSPYMCVEANYPTFRVFARNGGSGSTIAVEVLYKNTILSGGVLSGTMIPGSSWGPSPEMQTGAVIGGILSGGPTAQLALRFRATIGNSRIDDVFVDPRMH